MSMIYILLPLSLILAAVAVFVFIWAAKKGQFDDLETPAYRVLFEETIKEESASEETLEGNTSGNETTDD